MRAGRRIVILPGGFAAQDVGGSPEMGFELLLREFHRSALMLEMK
jgi:hypothetical protein